MAQKVQGGVTIIPNERYLTGADNDPPCLKLIGQSWPIPKFAPKQNTVIVPIIMSLVPRMVAAMNQSERDEDGKIVMVPMLDPETNAPKIVDGELQLIAKKRSVVDSMGEVLTEEATGKLYTALYYALTRAHPKLKREEFDEEWEIGTLELIDCIFTIADQTGVIKFQRPDKTKEAAALLFGQKVGEVEGANSRTGT